MMNLEKIKKLKKRKEKKKKKLVCGLSPQSQCRRPLQMAFQRAARTDKGVSAAGQVLSLKISILFCALWYY